MTLLIGAVRFYLHDLKEKDQIPIMISFKAKFSTPAVFS